MHAMCIIPSPPNAVTRTCTS